MLNDRTMNSHNKVLAVNTMVLGIGQLLPKLLALMILPLLTSYLNTDEYGTFDLILCFASLMLPILTLQIHQAIFRYLLGTTEKLEREKYVTNAICYVLTSSAFLLPLIYCILQLLNIKPQFSILICLLFFSEAIYTLLGQIVRGLSLNVKYSASVIIYAFVNLLLTMIFIIKLKAGLYGIVISLALAYFCSNLYMLIDSGLMKYVHLRAFSKNAIKELLAFSVPIVPSSIALWVVNLSDRLIVINFLGSSANGIYAVSNKIPTLYSSAYNIFNLAWAETASRVSDEGNPALYYSRMFKVLFNFLIGAMLLLIAVTPAVFAVFVKGDYGVAILQVPILYFGVFFNSFVNFYSGIYIALKRTSQVGISSAAGAILNILINIMLINKIGLYAASISTALSFMIIVLYRAYDLNKVIKITYDFKTILSGMAFFFISCSLLYAGENWCIVICFILAIIYNSTKNLSFVLKIYHLILNGN